MVSSLKSAKKCEKVIGIFTFDSLLIPKREMWFVYKLYRFNCFRLDLFCVTLSLNFTSPCSLSNKSLSLSLSLSQPRKSILPKCKWPMILSNKELILMLKQMSYVWLVVYWGFVMFFVLSMLQLFHLCLQLRALK